MDKNIFNTPLILSGPLRMPRQLLEDQKYDGHKSLHDASVADGLGLSGAPIEGPTHFSQFEPLLTKIWGQKWLAQGCLSVHFKSMVVEGEQVRAYVTIPQEGETRTICWAEKEDGTKVLEASASIGPNHGETLLEKRMAKLTPSEQLIILDGLKEGMSGAKEEQVRMDFDQHLGDLYPFTLNKKLSVITENSPYYTDATESPWDRPIIPMEMICVLAQYSYYEAGWTTKKPVIGLFADLEMRLIDGPLFVGEDYLIRREIVKLSESRRTESCWVRSRIFDKTGQTQVAEVLLNHAYMKQSYPHYEKEMLAIKG